MAKSAKAKKEKRKDFQKAKLKVGKTNLKASNVTDASFRSRSINVLHQSLSESAPTAESQVSHHLSLLNHKSESQKKESLSYLTTALQTSHSSIIPTPTSAILPKVQPLLLDPSGAVRSNCIRLLASLPGLDIGSNVETLLLYARAGITHLSIRIQLTGTDVLEWLLNVAGDLVISCPGGWLKTLNCLLVALGWKGLSSPKSNGGWQKTTILSRTTKSEDEEKLRTRLLVVLSLLLEIGLRQAKSVEDKFGQFPWFLCTEHAISKLSNPYGYLNLFGSARDEESEQYRDVEDRARVYDSRIAQDVVAGIENVKKDGGGIGRAAMGVERVLKTTRMNS